MASQCPGMISPYAIACVRCLTCIDLSDPNSFWSFCPNIAAAYLYTVLFGITMIAHLVQAILYKKPYCWVIVMSALLQTVGFISRILSIRSPAEFGEYATWFVLILVSNTLLKVLGRLVLIALC
jgi:hypothetical protein